MYIKEMNIIIILFYNKVGNYRKQQESGDKQ